GQSEGKSKSEKAESVICEWHAPASPLAPQQQFRLDMNTAAMPDFATRRRESDGTECRHRDEFAKADAIAAAGWQKGVCHALLDDCVAGWKRHSVCRL